MWHKKLFILLLVCVARNGHTQQPFVKNYQINEGLSSNYIYSVFQDSQGYIWLTSDVGISRFDGQSFVHYNTSNGLPDNEVFSLCEDSDGRIWFATLNGKPGFFYHGVIYNEGNYDLLKRCSTQGMVIKLFQQDDGRMVYCGGYKTILIDIKRQAVEERLTDDGIVTAWRNPGNVIGGASISFGQIKEGGFVAQAPMVKLAQTIQAITTGDTVIISSNRNLYFFNRTTGRLLYTLPPLEEGNQFIFLKILGNRLWTGSRNGVIVYEYPSMVKVKTYLSGRSVSSILKDREGGLWFSTFEEGIFYVPDPDIIHYGIADGLLHKRIICLSRDLQHRLWIGSEGSAYAVFDGKRIHSKVVFPKNKINKNILNIRQMADGRTMVIGKIGTLIVQTGRASQLFLHRATDINIDYKGDYWAGLNAVYQIPKQSVKKKMVPAYLAASISDGSPEYGYARASRLKGFKVEKIEFDEQKTVWIATHNGLFSVDPRGKETQLLVCSIKDLDFDPVLNILWVLSESKGLYAIQQGVITDSIAIRNQFGDVICRDICRADDNILWIGSANGLFRVQGSPGDLRLTNFRGVLGLGSDKINAVETIGDQIYIGKDDGLLAVPKSLLLQSPPSPPALIKSVKVNGIVQSTAADHWIHMPFGQGSLSIEFEGLSYREPQYIRYRYRLIGLDTLWHETANEALEFATLRPGQYTFEVFALNGAGEACEYAAQVQILVEPPFWMRYWFYLLVVSLTIALVIAYVKWREHRLRQGYEVERKLMESSREKSELQKKNTELRMLALRLQMNPHFIFNALNTIKGYYGQERTVEANAFIGKFARLLRLNLDYSDTMIPLDQELELLKIYLQLSQIRYPDKISYQLDVAPHLNPLDIMIPSMLLQPFVENAVIHGVAPKKEKGTIHVSIDVAGNEIIARVKDSGVGRIASAKLKLRDLHKPLATQITIERLQLLREQSNEAPVVIHDLYESGEAAGTEVVLHIPYQNNQQHDQRDHH